MHFLKHILSYVLLPLLILTIAATYYRFIILHDHIVSYEGVCDPELESCFVGCVDDECTEEYFYTHIERHAANLINLCGDDITECAAADSCDFEEDCYIAYCDPAVDVDLCDTVENSEVSSKIFEAETFYAPEDNTSSSTNENI